MRKDIEKYPEIKFLTMPKWATPVALFVAVAMIGFSVYQNRENFAFGNIFPFLSAKAQDRSISGPSKFGVNSAVWVDGLGDEVVRNSAALSGPGGTIVGLVGGTDQGWIGATKSFIESSNKYCLTPILRLVMTDSSSDWIPFFQAIGGNGGKLVISVGNEVNHRNEYSGDGSDYARYLSSFIDSVRPLIGSAKIIASPLNTSAYYNGDVVPATCDDASDLICWTNFIDQMGNIGDWKNKVDGHASNPYPLNGKEYNYYIKKELDKIGYSKPVYIMETGPHNAVASSPQEFMGKYWSGYCGDGNIAVVNLFNAAGNNPDPNWNGGVGNFVFNGSEVTDEAVSNCPMADMDIRYTDFSSCEIVDRSEYVPMATASGGLGVSSARCITSYQTSLIPEKQKYGDNSKAGEWQMLDGQALAYSELTINSVTTAKYFESLDIEYEGESIAASSFQSVQFNDLEYDVNFNLIANYPADGRYKHKYGYSVTSWADQGCASGNSDNQKASSLGLSWPVQPISINGLCGGPPVYNYPWTSYVEVVEPKTKYAYIYFPLGTALGAITHDPYNYFAYYDEPSDFVTEAKPWQKKFIGEATARIEFYEEKVTLWESIFSWWESLWGQKGVNDGNTAVPEFSEVGNDLTIDKYYTKETLAGEAGVSVGTLEYNQNCDALYTLWHDTYEDLKDEYEQKANEAFGRGDTERESAIYEMAEVLDANQGKIKRLWEECVGACGENCLRQVSIVGDLGFTAPFIPILAHERLQDAITSASGPVCDIAEEGLYAAEVDATLKWYDANRGVDGPSYKTCDHDGGNLLVNGSFENRGGAPGGTASGIGADGWTFAWKKNYTPGDPGDQSSSCNGTNGENLEYCKAPEFKPSSGGVDSRRVLDGELSSLWFTTMNKHDVIAYQEVTIPSSGYEVFGYFQGWRNNDEPYDGTVVTPPEGVIYTATECMPSCLSNEFGWNVPSDECEDYCADGVSEIPPSTGGDCVSSDQGMIGDSMAAICVYPGSLNLSGHEIPFAEWDSIWSLPGMKCDTASMESMYNNWDRAELKNLSAGTYTIILRGKADVAALNTDDYWDNVCLIPKGESKIGTIDIPVMGNSRTGGGGSSTTECSLYSPPEQSCTIEVEGADPLIMEQNFKYYIPGLGAIPSIRNRIVLAENKSPDYKYSDDNPANEKLCTNRDEGTMVNGKEFMCLSSLDVYIIQNLQPESMAIKWATAICPSLNDTDKYFTKEYGENDVAAAVKFIRGSGDVSQVGGGSGSGNDDDNYIPADGTNFDRTPTPNENIIMEECVSQGLTKEECAYVLATAQGESKVLPVEEGGCCDTRTDASRCTNPSLQTPCGCTANERQINYGKCDPDTNQCYYGRGFPQITGKSNYVRFMDILRAEGRGEIDLVNEPSLALNVDTSAFIMIYGMKHGSFTGAGFREDSRVYTPVDGSREKYVNARKIINGDGETYGGKFADLAIGYLNGSVMDGYGSTTP